jgi:glycosyltransferase involved in cell wall biosynthesis
MRYVKTGVRLTLVGNGPDEDGLREQIEKHGLQHKVELAGRVSDERLLELYLAALGVYYGPFDEDYGYVTLEGFAAHRPVVTLTDAGGPLEFVTDGETGWSPPRTPCDRPRVRPLVLQPPPRQEDGRNGNDKLRATVPAGPRSSRG